jgi:hypothetical protein
MEDFYNMADIGKNGYSYTGYTEPFIVPPGQTVAGTSLVPQTFGGDTIPNSVSENTAGTGYETGVYGVVGGGDGLTVQVSVGGPVTGALGGLPSGTTYTGAVGVATIGGEGTGLTVDTTAAAGPVTAAVTNAGGTGYVVGDVVTITGGTGDATATVLTTSSTGEVTSVSIVTAGSGYYDGETVTIDGGNGDATIDIVDAALPATTIPIEYSEFRNAGLYVRSYMTSADTATFTSKDLNFDTRMDDGFADKGKFLITDDDGATFVTIDSITYDNVTGLYTVTPSANVAVEAGKSYRVVARKPDVGISTGDALTAGQKCVRVYLPSELPTP